MHVLNLANANRPFFEYQIKSLQQRGIDCTTLMVPGRETPEDTRSVTDYLSFWPRAVREFDDTYDIVHANYGLLGPVAISQRSLPVVLSLWGTDLYGPLGPVSRAVAPFCDAVVVMSQAMADEFSRECDIIPHGIDTDRFQPEPQSKARQAVGWDANTYHVLFPYRPDREVKNYPLAERTVDAVNRVMQKPVTLHPVWGVSHDTFPQYMNAADCLLLSSRRDAAPNTVKEALACNLPVVSTDVGDVRERLSGVEPSTVCQSEAELVSGLVDVLQRGERSNGREAVEGLSLQWMSNQLTEVYERVIEEQGG